MCSTVPMTRLCVTNLLYDFLLLAVRASFQCLGVLCVQYHCELHRLKKWEGSSLSAFFSLFFGGETLETDKSQNPTCEQAPL